MHRAAAPLLLLFLSACAPKPAAPASSEPDAAPVTEEPTEPGDGDVEPTGDARTDEATIAVPDPAELEVGVPSCDRYVALYIRCIDEQMPEDRKSESYQKLQESVVMWRKAAETEAGQKGLADACQTAAEAVAATCGYEAELEGNGEE